MRRFIGFLILAISILLGVGFSTPGMMKSANLSLDFTAGKEFVYTVENYDETRVVDDKEMNKLVNDLSSRLDDAGVNRYEVIIEGNDQIRVRVTQDYESKYDHIKRLMSFNSTFTLTTSDGLHTATADEIFVNSRARVEFIGPEAYFVVPVSKNNKIDQELVKEANLLHETAEGEVTPDEGRLILWSDFQEGDSLEESKKEENDEMAQRIICMFDPANLYFDDNAKDKALAIKIDEYSIENNINAYALNADRAYMLVDLFNAKNIDLKLTFLFDDFVNPLAEDFINYDKPSTVNATRTLLALCVGLLLISIFMIVFYRLHGVSAVINMIATLFVSFAIFNVTGMVLNAAALVGIVLVSLLSLASSIVYLEHFKNEVYRGRSLKKANSEAHKKSFITLIDIHVIVLVLGLLTYFIGQTAVASLAVAAVIGALISFVSNITIYRALTWLSTNDTSFQNKYKVFAINKDLVPNLADEEKQTYYGPFAKTDFTKKAKRNGIGTIVATSIFAIAMLGFGIFSNGVVNQADNSNFTRAYYQIHEFGPNKQDNKNLSIEMFEEALSIKELSDLDIKVDQVKFYDTLDDNEEHVEYYVVDFTNYIDGETKVTINNKETTVADYLSSLIVSDDTEVDSMTLRKVRQTGTNPAIRNNQPSLENVLLTTAILIVVSSVYILIRFGLARGLTSLIASTLSTFLPLGFFALTRIATTSTTFISLMAIVMINTIVTIILAAKTKEVSADLKNAEVSIIDNNKHALSLAASPILIIGLIASYLALNFFGFGHPAFATTFAVLLLGVLVVLMLDLTLFVPTSMFFIKHFGDVNVHLPKIKKTKSREKVGNIKGGQKSAEPEEALFPGIND